jgi:large subunit ribosomal protein L22
LIKNWIGHLKFLPYKAKFPICKVINSAINNAENNFNRDKKKLFITEAYANEGPKLKRMKFRSRGNSSTIEKKTCHITKKINEKEKIK